MKEKQKMKQTQKQKNRSGFWVFAIIAALLVLGLLAVFVIPAKATDAVAVPEAGQTMSAERAAAIQVQIAALVNSDGNLPALLVVKSGWDANHAGYDWAKAAVETNDANWDAKQPALTNTVDVNVQDVNARSYATGTNIGKNGTLILEGDPNKVTLTIKGGLVTAVATAPNDVTVNSWTAN
jgi:type II secretory pathway pseudopilin PulG